MTVLQGIILGALQGVAEFLPVSSSGHLAVAQRLLGITDVPLLYSIFLHLATLLAVIIFFRTQILRLFVILWRWITRQTPAEFDAEDGLAGSDERGRRTIAGIIAGTFITGVIGIATSRLIPELPVRYICAGFIVTAVCLICSSRIQPRKGQGDGVSLKQAVFIGLAQGIGTLPGVSRSGSTISGALFCGVNRADAGVYSFIVSIPAVFGAFLLELKDIGEVYGSVGLVPVISGCATAFVVGYVSLSWLMRFIKKGNLAWFACYLIPAGILGFLFL